VLEVTSTLIRRRHAVSLGWCLLAVCGWLAGLGCMLLALGSWLIAAVAAMFR
jgi:hypothetical protein